MRHGNSVCLSVTRVDQSKTVEASIVAALMQDDDLAAHKSHN